MSRVLIRAWRIADQHQLNLACILIRHRNSTNRERPVLVVAAATQTSTRFRRTQFEHGTATQYIFSATEQFILHLQHNLVLPCRSHLIFSLRHSGPAYSISSLTVPIFSLPALFRCSTYLCNCNMAVVSAACGVSNPPQPRPHALHFHGGGDACCPTGSICPILSVFTGLCVR